MLKTSKTIGKKYGRLVVVSKNYELSTTNKQYFNCICDCGNKKVVSQSNLTSGSTVSCGCYNKEKAYSNLEKMLKTNTTHGKCNTRLYKILENIKTRVSNKNHKDYKYYGAKGIALCKEWNDFKQFYDWSIKNGYKEDLQIDRIDNEGNYEPNNCRWTTASANNQNKRKQENKTSKYVGVNFHKHSNKWKSEITKNKKSYYLGIFENEKDAAEAYNAKAKELYGKFAKLNVL
jgi:hypothetical protein